MEIITFMLFENFVISLQMFINFFLLQKQIVKKSF